MASVVSMSKVRILPSRSRQNNEVPWTIGGDLKKGREGEGGRRERENKDVPFDYRD